jgi:amidase
MTAPDAPFHLLEASIEEVLAALASGRTTSVELTARCLARIGAFDRSGPRLNAVPLLNPEALEEAAASDRRRREGQALPLEGIPFTVKDSYMVRGLTVASGSPAFRDLVAGRDAFTVERLRAAGAVLVGKTTMPPMADGGMQRGLYGRAESPYNPEYLPAAYASGSSNGSGVATASNFAVFGMGEETVSSGRSPASNNALCAYTPSRGLISIRGNWPLFPTRDVVVPHTRSVADLLAVLDVIVADDPETRGDFWRAQRAVPLPAPSEHRPEDYRALADPDALRGKRLGVPRMYLGRDPQFPIDLQPSVLALWEAARGRLEALGAEVVEVGFPVIEQYEGSTPGGEELGRLGVLPEGWMDREFNEILAFGWDDFLRANADPRYPSLAEVDPDLIFPMPPGSLPDRYDEVANYGDRYRSVVALAQAGLPRPEELPGFDDALRALEQLRKELFEDWLAANGLDAVVFPAAADVAPASADLDPGSADRAWANGVFFSNGNYALRHFGIPSVTVPMGAMADLGMPVGLTFAGPAHSDLALLAYSSAFEAASPARPVPPLAPALAGDALPARGPVSGPVPAVTLEAQLGGPAHDGARRLTLSGTAAGAGELAVTVDGVPVAVGWDRDAGTWSAAATLAAPVMPPAVGGNPVASQALVVVVATGPGGAAGAFAEL